MATVSQQQNSFETQHHQAVPFSEATYHTSVLQLPTETHEDEVDERLGQEAQELGIKPAPGPNIVDGLASSLSATTIASDHNNHGSIMSQSTAPTSCSSSERRPPIHDSKYVDPSPPPSMISDMEKKKRENGFRKGIRRVTGFRKRRSLAISSSTLASINSNSDMANSLEQDRSSVRSGLRSPTSTKSRRSSLSQPPSVPKSSYERPIPFDDEAVNSSLDSKELQTLRERQLAERTRFLNYQRVVLSQLRSEHHATKLQRQKLHQEMVERQTAKNDRLIEDLEARQLEEELKLVHEFDLEKKAIMVRLKHMEAYCQNPTPPPTPVDTGGKGRSVDSQLPERRVTEKDYHNLAQQYRERDAIDSLHASKINVLRGKQKKAIENFTRNRERLVETLVVQHEREIAVLEGEVQKEENVVNLAFDAKKVRLESRWRLQSLIAATKMERASGHKFAPLPDLRAAEDASVERR